MKRVASTIDLRKISRTVREMMTVSRIFIAVSAFTFFIFVLIGLGGMVNKQIHASSMSSMKGIAFTLTSRFFLDLMGLEVPYLQSRERESTFSQKNALRFVAQYLTGVDPRDPKSLLSGTIPAMNRESANVLYSAKTGQPVDFPADFTPNAKVFRPVEPSGGKNALENPAEANASVQPANPQSDAAQPDTHAIAAETLRKKTVLIYHSHNRESFLPELQEKGIKSPDLAYDSKINMTLIGKRLSDKLQQLGVGTIYSDIDYPSVVKDFNFAKSYAYSAKTVKEAFASHPDLHMVFDVHRDSLERDRTTARINGKDYAQVYLVVGKKNPQWEKNSEFAGKIHDKLEERLPGISKGVFGKSSHGNAEYNQSLSPNSILLEIGGPYNTLEEMYRTADILAEVIADIYWQAEKVNAPSSSAGNTPAGLSGEKKRRNG